MMVWGFFEALCLINTRLISPIVKRQNRSGFWNWWFELSTDEGEEGEKMKGT
jgi:hypothetical protein